MSGIAPRIASFFPAAWAVFIALYIHHINQDPHQIVILNLLIAVPMRGVRLAATVVLTLFVVVLVLEIGLWWLPGAIVAIIVTVQDWKCKPDAIEENEESPSEKQWWVR